MKYLVLLIGDGELKAWPEHTAQEKEEAMGRFWAFDQACSERAGVEILSGEALAESTSATVMRTRGDEVSLTEGPYAEVVEGMGGFFLVEAPDLDVLVELLRILPPYDIQIHPTVDPMSES